MAQREQFARALATAPEAIKRAEDLLMTQLPAFAADDIKSGPDKKIGGPFDVKAITGDNAGKKLCYV